MTRREIESIRHALDRAVQAAGALRDDASPQALVELLRRVETHAGLAVGRATDRRAELAHGGAPEVPQPPLRLVHKGDKKSEAELGSLSTSLSAANGLSDRLLLFRLSKDEQRVVLAAIAEQTSAALAQVRVLQEKI